jgi:site-specific recombinase XerD
MKYSLKFVLREDLINKSGKCPLCLRYTYNRKLKNFPLKYTLEPEFWDKETSTITRRYENINGLKKMMGDFEGKIIDLVEDYYYNNKEYPTVEKLTTLLNSIEKESNSKGRTITVKSLYDGFILYKKGLYVELSTISIYKQTWEKWTSFEKTTGKIRDLKEMNEKSLTEFKVFLLNQGLQKNTIGKFIKTMKSFLNYVSLHLEMDVPPSFKRVVVDREEKKDFQVLTRSELEDIKREVFFSRYYGKNKYDLTERQILIGRILVFLCSTGLSFVDFDKLTIDDIHIDYDKLTKDKSVILLIDRQKLKTTEDCIIPILDITIDLLSDMLGIPHEFIEPRKDEPTDERIKMNVLESLLKRMKKGVKLTEHQPRIFPLVYVQDFNKEVKELMSIIGLTYKVPKKKLVKGKIVKEQIPKSQLISSITGRRTYITLCLEQGISPHILMETTGHKKIGTLLRYNKNSKPNILKEFRSKIDTKGFQIE